MCACLTVRGSKGAISAAVLATRMGRTIFVVCFCVPMWPYSVLRFIRKLEVMCAVCLGCARCARNLFFFS